MKYRRMISFGLAVLMAVSMSACGSTGKTDKASSSTGAAVSASKAASGESAEASSVASGSSDALSDISAIAMDPANTKKTDETLVVSCQSEPSGLWAGTGKMENEIQIIDNTIMDRLVKLSDDKKEVLPSLATDWDWTDSNHIRFTLRDDVTMTDGSPLTPEDCVYTFQTLAANSANTDTGRYIDPDTTSVNDEHSFTLGLKEADPDILYMLAWSNFGIISEDEVNAAGGIDAVVNTPVMGCGRYKFSDWVRGESVTVERNENYWDPDYVGYYKTIKFVFTQDPAAREMAVEAGNAQVAMQMPVSQAATYAGNPAVQVKIYGFGQVHHLYYNLRDGACKDQKVREAIQAALDFNAIAQIGTAGYSGVATGWFANSSKYHTDTYKEGERTRDIEKAKKLLAEAGYPDGLEISTVTTADGTTLATAVQDQLRETGITLTVNTADTPQFVQDAFNGTYDIIFVGSDEFVRTPTAFTAFRTANLNYCIGGPKWTTDEIDQSIAEALSETDEDKAKDELAQIEQTFKENDYVEDLFEEQYSVILAPNLKGITTMERGWPDVTTFYAE